MQLLRRVDLAPQPDLGGHRCGALPQNRRRQLVARLIYQRACKVLALAHNHALGKRRFHGLLVRLARSDQCEHCTLGSLRSLR